MLETPHQGPDVQLFHAGEACTLQDLRDPGSCIRDILGRSSLQATPSDSRTVFLWNMKVHRMFHPAHVTQAERLITNHWKAVLLLIHWQDIQRSPKHLLQIPIPICSCCWAWIGNWGPAGQRGAPKAETPSLLTRKRVSDEVRWCSVCFVLEPVHSSFSPHLGSQCILQAQIPAA